jgi:hypothetical protein
VAGLEKWRKEGRKKWWNSQKVAEMRFSAQKRTFHVVEGTFPPLKIARTAHRGRFRSMENHFRSSKK